MFDIKDLLELKYLNKIFKNDLKISKNEVVRKLLNILVTDLIENSQNKINLANIKNIDDVYKKKLILLIFLIMLILG